MNIEVWVHIEGYKGLYEVSSLGRIRNAISGFVLKPLPRGDYLCVDLYKDGLHKKHGIHRLVAKAFKKNPCNKPYVMHLDSNTYNNEATNLEWGTAAENNLHAFRVGGRAAVKSHLGKFGAEANNSQPVICITQKGEVIEFVSAKEAADVLNINYRNAAAAARTGKYMRRKKVTLKYKNNE
jgi:hypothetical protein